MHSSKYLVGEEEMTQMSNLSSHLVTLKKVDNRYPK
jgi:hypothetical protein